MKRGIHRTTFALILILSFYSLNICRANGVYPKYYADTVYIYGDVYNPPYEKLSENGKPEGYTIETIREVMHKLNLPYKIQLVERKDMRSKLNSHRHVLLLGAAFFVYGKEHIIFSDTYRYAFKRIVTRKEDAHKYDVLKYLHGKKIAVEDGSYSLRLLQSKGLSKEIVPLGNLKNAFADLNNGKYDAVFCEGDLAQECIREAGLDNELEARDAAIEPYKYGLAANDSALLNDINAVMVTMKHDGTDDQIFKRWFYLDPSARYLTMLKYSILTLVILALFIIILRHEVRKARRQTAEQNRRLSLALNAGGVSVWGYDTAQKRFYNIDCDFFPKEGQPYDEVAKNVHPDDLTILEQALLDVGRGKTSKTICIRIDKHHAGHWKYAELQISSLQKRQDTITHIIGTERDITEDILKQKRIDLLLKRYSILFNNTSIACGYLTPEGDLIDINEAACKMFGFASRKAFLDTHFNLFESPLTRNLFDPHDMRAFSSIVKVDYDHDDDFGRKTVSTNKGVRYYESHITPVYDENKVLQGIISNVFDRTEEKTMTTALRKSLQNTEFALKSANMIMWEFNFDTMNCYCHNDTINNYEGNEIPLEELFTVINPEDARTIRKTIEDSAENGGKTVNINIRILRKWDMTWRYCTLTGTMNEKDETTGKPKRYIGFCLDNTDIIHLSKDVEEYSLRIQQLLDATGVLEWTYDPETEISESYSTHGGKNALNWKELLNSVAESSKETVRDIFEKMNRRAVDNFSIQVKLNNMHVNPHTAYYTIDGTAIRDLEGKILKYSGLSHNITKVMEVQEKLEIEKVKAQRADRLKTAFLANMSHEIRTPLNSIVGFSQLLQTADDRDERTHFMEIINNNNVTLIKLIDEILELSKIESGAVDIKNETFNLPDFIRDYCETAKYQNKKENLEIICDIPDPDYTMTTDKSILRSILTNLMDNAYKFTEKGSITMGFQFIAQQLDIFVSDTGIGIPEDKRETIFTSFEKLDTFTQGVGIGLSICKANAELLGGHILVDSCPGKGSCFHLQLPL